MTTETMARGQAAVGTLTAWGNAVLNNGLGRYGDAVGAAQSAHTATDAFRRLITTTTPSGTEWALAVEARSRALLSDGAEAERLYCESD